MNRIKFLAAMIGFFTGVLPLHAAAAQATDPGVRQDTTASGLPIAGLTAPQKAFFATGQGNFEIEQMLANGLGPRFNLNSCGGCHAYPAPGGSSPALNPQIALATAYGARNKVPSFLNIDGPVRAVRFVNNAQGMPDGSVHSLFVISGMVDVTADASKCRTVQEDFETQAANGNLAFRIPTPIFGAGLIEQLGGTTLSNNVQSNNKMYQSLGISGRLSHSPNTGMVNRFGWKAQIPSLLMFSSEAYNVEMGITNENFPQERDETPSCQFSTRPNDLTDLTGKNTGTILSSSEKNTFFMRFLAPPKPSTSTPGNLASIKIGQGLFSSIGCVACHTPALTTDANSTVAAFDTQTANLYSDLALHNMGPGLADGIMQGAARGDEFRTPPLWGLGQRLFLLHDGRTSDLITAITAHGSNADASYQESEANAVIAAFNQLSEANKQDLLNFLRSL